MVMLVKFNKHKFLWALKDIMAVTFVRGTTTEVEKMLNLGRMKEILPSIEITIVGEETITQQYRATLRDIVDWMLKDIVYKK